MCVSSYFICEGTEHWLIWQIWTKYDVEFYTEICWLNLIFVYSDVIPILPEAQTEIHNFSFKTILWKNSNMTYILDLINNTNSV